MKDKWYILKCENDNTVYNTRNGKWELWDDLEYSKHGMKNFKTANNYRNWLHHLDDLVIQEIVTEIVSTRTIEFNKDNSSPVETK